MAATGQLSFLPDDYLERKAQRRTNVICAVLFILVVAGLLSYFTFNQTDRKRAEQAHRKVEDEFIGEARRIEQVKQMQEKQKRMARQAELTASLLEKVPRGNILAELTNALPQGVSLLDFKLESRARAKKQTVDSGMTEYEKRKAARENRGKPQEAAPIQAEPKNFDVAMTLSGLAPNDSLVAALLTKLNASRLLKDVNLKVSEEHVVRDKEGKTDTKLRKFTIEMMLDPVAEVRAGETAPALESTSTSSVEVKQ